MTERQPDVSGIQFWLDKAVAWNEANDRGVQKDAFFHLNGLGEFLQQILASINRTSSPAEALQRLPCVVQLLGQLCWIPAVTAMGKIRTILLQCIFALHSDHPKNPVEVEANQWIGRLLQQLTRQEDDPSIQVLLDKMNAPTKTHHLHIVNKLVTGLQRCIKKTNLSQMCIDGRCSCDNVRKISEVCLPAVSCPEAAPLINALLQQPTVCIKETLGEEFLRAVDTAHNRRELKLEDEALFSLWCRSMRSLEDAVLRLLDSVTVKGLAQKLIQQKIAKSLLPKASAQRCSIFLVINDIFRSFIKQAERSFNLKAAIHIFTRCFLKELTLLQPQTVASLKDFFPQSPPDLLVPLLTTPTEMPAEAQKKQLKLLSGSLQRLTAEEEDRGSSGQQRAFEVWFLLVQNAHWVHAAAQLLFTSGSDMKDALLWLLTFYHHPTNRWHQRAERMERAREVLDLIQTLPSAFHGFLPVDATRPFVGLSADPQPSLTLFLLLHFLVFGSVSHKNSVQLLQMVLDQSCVLHEAAFTLSSLQLRLSESGEKSHLRINEFLSTIQSRTHTGDVYTVD